MAAPLVDSAIERMRQLITLGEWRSGDRLPSEAELSLQLGVSRSSTREAVRALIAARVLDVRRGDGTYVTSLEPKLLLEAMSFVVALHEDTSILELFEVRRILEPAAAALATRRCQPADIERLVEMLDEVDIGTSVEDLVAHDLKFHGFINDLSGNSYLSSLLDSLSSHTLRARIWRGLTEEGSVARTLAEHRAIAEAMASADTELVRSCVSVHISGVERWLAKAAGSADG